jgi:fidgetin-like protein 1
MFKSEVTILKGCVDTENRTNQNNNKHPAYLAVEEDEKPRGSFQNTKRKHTGFRSPICEVVNSPSSNDESDAPINTFTTARAMMVWRLINILLLPVLPIFGCIILYALIDKYFGWEL